MRFLVSSVGIHLLARNWLRLLLAFYFREDVLNGSFLRFFRENVTLGMLTGTAG